MLKELLKLNGKELDIKYPIELFDDNGKRTYYEYSTGYWYKSEYDKDGNRAYYKNSYGTIKDNRPKVKELNIDECRMNN